jgi:hypothetical protein
MPCTQTEVLRFFGETYCLSLQGLKVKQEISRRKQAEPLFFILEDGTVCLTIHRWNFIRLLPFVATVLRAWHPTIMTECCEIYRTVRTSMCGALLSSLHTSQAFEPTSPFIIILIQTKPNPPLFPEASRFATTVGSLSLFNHVRVSAARMVTLTRRDYWPLTVLWRRGWDSEGRFVKYLAALDGIRNVILNMPLHFRRTIFWAYSVGTIIFETNFLKAADVSKCRLFQSIP